jgi:hypothetical protein
LARPGFDFQQWRVRQRCRAIAERHDLSDGEALAVLAIVTLYDWVADVHAAALAVHEEGGEAALAASPPSSRGKWGRYRLIRTAIMARAPQPATPR